MVDPFLLFALILGAASVALVVWGSRRSGVAPLLSLTWCIYGILWCVLPLMLQPLLREPIANSAGPLSRAQLAVLHSSLLLVLALVHLAFKAPRIDAVTRFFDRRAPNPARMFWPLVLSLVLLTGVELALSKLNGSTFADQTLFPVTADAGELAQSGLLSVVLITLVGFAIAVISMNRDQGATRASLLVAWAQLFVFSGFAVSRGLRSAVLMPMVVGIVALSTLRGRARRRATGMVAVAGLVTIVLGAPIAGVMGYLRSGTDAVSIDLVLDAYQAVFGGNSVGQQVSLLLEETNRKFDAVGPGVELLAMEPPGFAGVAPFMSASVSAIPRALYQSKPVPTSRDGTYLGTPYRIAAKAYGDPELGMVVPVSATAIALWEFGILGPIVFLLMNIINLVCLNTLLLSRNILARALGISMLGLPAAEFFIAPPSLVLQNNLRLVLLVSVLAIALLAWEMFEKSAVFSNRPLSA